MEFGILEATANSFSAPLTISFSEQQTVSLEDVFAKLNHGQQGGLLLLVLEKSVTHLCLAWVKGFGHIQSRESTQDHILWVHVKEPGSNSHYFERNQKTRVRLGRQHNGLSIALQVVTLNFFPLPGANLNTNARCRPRAFLPTNNQSINIKTQSLSLPLPHIST